LFLLLILLLFFKLFIIIIIIIIIIKEEIFGFGNCWSCIFTCQVPFLSLNNNT